MFIESENHAYDFFFGKGSDKGYSISNVDITIAMQKPKLRPYIDSMRERLAEVIGIGADRVSVKATTTEKLGFEGREEGVSATAVALLIK